jgi:hypothetical protein
MSEKGVPELSKVINLILENPKLIEEISRLSQEKSEDTGARASESQSVASDTYQEVAKITEESKRSTGRSTNRRAELLGALKPFLSSERAKAIDSMMTIADILDVMKAR